MRDNRIGSLDCVNTRRVKVKTGVGVASACAGRVSCFVHGYSVLTIEHQVKRLYMRPVCGYTGRMAALPKATHRKPKAQRKGELLRIRLTAEQKRLFTETANQVGLDLSAWLRTVAIREAKAAGTA